MGFFKKIGNKIKRAVSIKNLTRAVTGNFSAVGEDLLRIARTEDPNAKQKTDSTGAYPISQNFQVPEFVNESLDTVGRNFSNNLTTKMANSPLVRKNVADVNQFVFSVWWKATWTKYKKWIIGGTVAIIALFIWKFRKPKNRSYRRR